MKSAIQKLTRMLSEPSAEAVHFHAGEAGPFVCENPHCESPGPGARRGHVTLAGGRLATCGALLVAAVVLAPLAGLLITAARGVAVPPVEVYRVGGEHVLVDGHHRVSVARDLGLQVIDARVVELRPRTR